MKSQNPNTRRTRRIKTGPNINQNNLYMVVPYHQGLSERIKRTCNKFGVQVHFKGGQTIKKPPHGSQGQGSYHKQKWSHLQI